MGRRWIGIRVHLRIGVGVRGVILRRRWVVAWSAWVLWVRVAGRVWIWIWIGVCWVLWSGVGWVIGVRVRWVVCGLRVAWSIGWLRILRNSRRGARLRLLRSRRGRRIRWVG